MCTPPTRLIDSLQISSVSKLRLACAAALPRSLIPTSLVPPGAEQELQRPRQPPLPRQLVVPRPLLHQEPQPLPAAQPRALQRARRVFVVVQQ